MTPSALLLAPRDGEIGENGGLVGCVKQDLAGENREFHYWLWTLSSASIDELESRAFEVDIGIFRDKPRHCAARIAGPWWGRGLSNRGNVDHPPRA